MHAIFMLPLARHLRYVYGKRTYLTWKLLRAGGEDAPLSRAKLLKKPRSVLYDRFEGQIRPRYRLKFGQGTRQAEVLEMQAPPEVQVFKKLLLLLRHGADRKGFPIRRDGYVEVTDVINYPPFQAYNLHPVMLKRIVKSDAKRRLELAGAMIRARGGHTIETVELERKPITSVSDIPSGMAVHWTHKSAWKFFSHLGISSGDQKPIYLCQHAYNRDDENEMRPWDQVMIYVDVKRALDEGIKFSMSESGVIVTEGDEAGCLPTKFFEKAVDAITGIELPFPARSRPLCGVETDALEVRISKTVTWLLRHGAEDLGIPMRKDGFVQVSEVLNYPALKERGLDFETLKKLVENDSRQRREMILEAPKDDNLSENHVELAQPTLTGSASTEADISARGIWWIRARSRHSIESVEFSRKSITSVSDIPSGVAIFWSNRKAWKFIKKQGISKGERSHILLAQHVPKQPRRKKTGRPAIGILVYVAVQKAIDVGIQFNLFENGVISTEGDERGYLPLACLAKAIDAVKGTEIWNQKRKNRSRQVIHKMNNSTPIMS